MSFSFSSLFSKIPLCCSSADISRLFELKGKSRKMFDITGSTKSVIFLNFYLVGGGGRAGLQPSTLGGRLSHTSGLQICAK